MKVLVVTDRYWPEGGGAELATHLIVGILREHFDVTVVTGSKSPLKHVGIKYIYEPLLAKWEKPILWLNATRLAMTERFEKLLRNNDTIYVPRYVFPIIPRAKKLGKRVIVHLHDYIPISYMAVILAPYEEHKHKIIANDLSLTYMKGLKYTAVTGAIWWLPRLARRWISQADKVICVSRKHGEIISDLAPEFRGKIEVIYNPPPPKFINVEPKKEPDDTPTFLYAGGDSYVKGFPILLQIIKRLGIKNMKVNFILTNYYSNKNLKILTTLNEKYNSVNINVVGRINYEEVMKLHRKAWALLFPSIWEEPLPYTIIEAGLRATIPVTFKVGGLREILEATPAEKFAIEPCNVKQMEKLIENICLLSPFYVSDLGTRMREELLKKFEISRTKERIHSIISGI